MNDDNINNDDLQLLDGLASKLNRHKEITEIDKMINDKLERSFPRKRFASLRWILPVLLLSIGAYFILNNYNSERLTNNNIQEIANPLDYIDTKSDANDIPIIDNSQQPIEIEPINESKQKIDALAKSSNNCNIQLKIKDKSIPYAILTLSDLSIDIEQLRTVLQNSLSNLNYKINYGDLSGKQIKIEANSKHSQEYMLLINSNLQGNAATLEIELFANNNNSISENDYYIEYYRIVKIIIAEVKGRN